jgi:hypothetical protein
VIITLAVPAYRQTVHVQTATAWVQDALAAKELGWTPVPFWVDCSGISRARNLIVKAAEDMNARLLLMTDSDTFPDVPDGGLKHMWHVMQQESAAVVGAAVMLRNGERVNCEPARPGGVYPGVVGTAYMLIDLWKLRELPKPWFVHTNNDDGLSTKRGEDIYFCRLAADAGHRVIVNYALPMAHHDQSVARTFE